MSQDPHLKQTFQTVNLVGQVGCVTAVFALLLIGVAFGLGWLLDDLLGNERKVMTVIFMLLSFPATLYVMVRISLTMVDRAQKQQQIDQKDHETQEKKEDTTT